MIRNVKIYPIYDHRGEPTIKVKVWTVKGFFTANVPSKSPGVKNLPYEKILDIFPRVRSNLIGLDETDWITSDRILEQIDDTNDFGKIGVNLALGISLAIARAASENELWRLEGPKRRFFFPYPMTSVVAGGKYGGKSAWQEFLILPQRVEDPIEAVKTNLEIWKVVGEELKAKNSLLGRTTDNVWISDLTDPRNLDFLSKLSEDWNFRIGIDFAASNFWDGRNYVYRSMRRRLKPEEQLDFILRIAEDYKVYYLEDPFHPDDFKSFSELNKISKRRVIAGDELYRTNTERVIKGIYSKSSDYVMVKPDQTGTLYRAFKIIDLMKGNDMIPIVSRTSCGVDDDWIVDLSILWSAPIIKTGGFESNISNRLIELWKDVPNNRMAILP
jgi:enolase